MIERIKECISDADSTLLVIDYDRTLVTGSKDLQAITQSELLSFQQRGGKIAIASGRPKSGLDKVANLLELEKFNGYIIGVNGAEIYSYEDDEYIANNKIDNKSLKKALDKLQSLPLKKGIYSKTELHVSDHTRDLQDEADSNCLDLVICDVLNTKIDSSKIVLSNTREDTHNYYDIACQLIGNDYNVVRSSPRYIEITNTNADKGLGIDVLRQHCPKIKNVIGIGDSQNDENMLKYSDYKIAMGNSTNAIKELSDIVIKSNEEDGIGVFLEACKA